MWAFIFAFFKNNGHLRGGIYFAISFLTPVAASFTEWETEGPKNWYAVVAVLIGAFISGLTSIRAYLDNHLSNGKNTNE